MGHWLLATLTGREQSQRWCRDHGLDIRSMSEGVLTGGGALVPDEMSSAVIYLVEQYGVARQQCRVIPMQTDLMVIPKRTGGLTGYFVGENSDITNSDVSWGQIELTPKKYATLTRISNELQEDAIIDVAGWVAKEAAQAFAEQEDDCWLNGDGTITYGGMTGVRTKLVDGNHAAGAVDAASGHNTLAEITTGDLDSMMAALPAYALKNAKFYTSASGYANVFQRLIEAAGGLTLADMVTGPIRKGYMGHEVVISQKMPTGASTDYTNEAMLLFGDMSLAVAFGERRAINAMVDNSRYMELDQTAVRVTERFHINVHDLGDGTTAGPIVGLIGN